MQDAFYLAIYVFHFLKSMAKKLQIKIDTLGPMWCVSYWLSVNPGANYSLSQVFSFFQFINLLYLTVIVDEQLKNCRMEHILHIPSEPMIAHISPLVIFPTKWSFAIYHTLPSNL